MRSITDLPIIQSAGLVMILAVVLIPTCFILYIYLIEKGKQFRLRRMEKSLEINPYNVQAYIELARDNIFTRPEPYDSEKALDYLNKAIELEPENIEAINLRALHLGSNLKRHKDAIKDLTRILEIDEYNTDIINLRANYYYFGLRDIEKAVDDINLLLKINPNDEDAKNFQRLIRFDINSNTN